MGAGSVGQEESAPAPATAGAAGPWWPAEEATSAPSRRAAGDDALVSWWLGRTRALGLPVAPARRRHLLSLGALGAAVAYPLKTLSDRTADLPPVGAAAMAAAILVLLGFAWGCYRAARDFTRLPAPVRRHPQLALHAAFWVAVAALWLGLPGPLRAVLVPVVVVLPFLLWRCGYLLLSGQRGRVAGTAFRDHLFHLFPVWGGSNVPYGKGPDHLARHEATSLEALARTQLAGVRLLGLALLWAATLVALGGLLYGDAENPVTRALGGWSLGLPRLAELVDGRRAAPRPAAWASLYGQLVLDTLAIAVQGHLYIGVLRLLGFHVPRNTDRPLLAQSVVEFWNRYYFYFKELMVEFFFLPTFTRHLRTRPRLRMIAAVFAAAFVGNVYYHLLKTDLVTGDWNAVWGALEARVLYAALLATGIAVSMHREQQRRTRPDAARRLPAPLRIAAVWTYLAVIRVWAADGTTAGILPRARFLLALAGLG
jgi:hypothetical protein